MAVMDPDEAFRFCKDVADCANRPQTGRLSDQAVEAVKKFRSYFHGRILQAADKLGDDWRGKNELVATAGPRRVRRRVSTAPSTGGTKFGQHPSQDHFSMASRGYLDARSVFLDTSVWTKFFRMSPNYLTALLANSGETVNSSLLEFFLASVKAEDVTGGKEAFRDLLSPIRQALPEFERPEAERLLPVHQALRRLVDRWRLEYPALAKIADSNLLQSVQIAAAALRDDPVLILGPTGTGKELSARAIHDMGRGHQKKFMTLNCAAIPEALFESELFGHDRGAFTGATKRKIGLVQETDRGTLFLDEIGRAPVKIQDKLLRTLEERQIRRLGSIDDIPVDVRFVFATSANLSGQVADSTFLPDLYQRLRPDFALELPAIDMRPREDVKEIWERCVRSAEDKLRKKEAGPTGNTKQPPPREYQVSPKMLDLICRPWPGNIRQLKFIANEIVHCRGVDTSHPGNEDVEQQVLEDVIAREESRKPQDVAKPGITGVDSDSRPTWPSRPVVAEAVKALALQNNNLLSVGNDLDNAVIEAVLGEENGSRSQAAKRLGLNRAALNQRILRSKKAHSSGSPPPLPAKP
jgi:DNA-binding NtrC family response regulator